MTDGGDVTEEVAGVGVLGHQPERSPFARAADEDRDTAGPHRPGEVQRAVRPVEATLEGELLLGEHPAADLHRLLEAPEALAGRRELEAVAVVLVLVPRRPDAQDGSARRHDVQRGDDLGEQRGVPVRHPGDHGSQGDPGGPSGDPPEQRVGLQHRLGPPAHVGDLVEVVHHPDRIEPRLLGSHCDLGDALEQILIGDAGVGEAGDLEAESEHLSHAITSLSNAESGGGVPVVLWGDGAAPPGRRLDRGRVSRAGRGLHAGGRTYPSFDPAIQPDPELPSR